MVKNCVNVKPTLVSSWWTWAVTMESSELRQQWKMKNIIPAELFNIVIRLPHCEFPATRHQNSACAFHCLTPLPVHPPKTKLNTRVYRNGNRILNIQKQTQNIIKVAHKWRLSLWRWWGMTLCLVAETIIFYLYQGMISCAERFSYF